MCRLPRLRVQVLHSLIVLLCAKGSLLSAQAARPTTAVASPVPVPRQFETRAQLEERAQVAERQQRTAEAWLLRSRIERGDFQEGDRIVFILEGGTLVLDTLQVRTGKVLQFPQMGELSLDGVLRSELPDRIRQHLAKYLTSPIVRATPLLPVALFGNVLRPGYYYTPADVVLRDVIMSAGGPAPLADMNKIVIRRGGEVIWKPEDVRVALTDGLSLDGLHLRAGDEIFIPEQRRFQFTNATAILSSSVALLLAIVQLSR